jgi:hypothetical protein
MKKNNVANLLIRHQEVFSKNEWDIGLTKLAKHGINTCNARPIKQRPRKVPLAFADE